MQYNSTRGAGEEGADEAAAAGRCDEVACFPSAGVVAAGWSLAERSYMYRIYIFIYI